MVYNQTDWDKWILLAQIALDNKTATSTEVSPFFLAHGWHAFAITIANDAMTNSSGNVLNPKQKGEAIVAKLKRHKILLSPQW